MALALKVTAAGRQALVNAGNTGTLPVTVDAIGITDQAFTAAVDGSDLALPGELKQLATFGGAATAADTIHLTIRDDSADAYSCRGFALYLADGTLFALYGQADVILEKTAASTFLLATDTIFADIDATSLTFGGTEFLNPAATTEVQGVVELATDAEAVTGTDTTRAVTPSRLKAALDARFGVGSPSDFFKPLMVLASATLLRAALAIKGAALKDEGAGNGLDADKLDGQHGAYYLDYNNFTNVPSSPGAPSQAWVDITGKPDTATRWPAWAEVTDKPATYTPSAHSQDWSTITGTPAFTQRWPTWSEVTGKPVLFAPSAHTHPISDIIGLQAALDLRAPLASPSFTGNVSMQQSLTMVNGTNECRHTIGPGGWYIYSNSANFGIYDGPNNHGVMQISKATRAVHFYGDVSTDGNFDTSDARLKHAIRPHVVRPLHRAIPFCSWKWNKNGEPGRGPLAQVVKAVEPIYTCEFDTDDGPRLGVNHARLALEIAMWAAHQVDHLARRASDDAATIADLRARVQRLEESR